MSIDTAAMSIHPLVAAAMRLTDDLLVARVEDLAHNAYEAELVFGERAVRRSRKGGQREGGGAEASHGAGGPARLSL
jgi:hypothetical protein